MRSKSPRLYTRIRELGGWARVRQQAGGRPTRLYAMTFTPRYGAKTTLSTRRQTQTIKGWAPYA